MVDHFVVRDWRGERGFQRAIGLTNAACGGRAPKPVLILFFDTLMHRVTIVRRTGV